MSERYFTVPFEMGRVVIRTGEDGRVEAIHFDLENDHREREEVSGPGTRVRSYLEGREVRWDFELNLDGLTAFRRKVYERVARIPYGKTATYGEIAADVGCTGGARAVGQAMACNMFPLVVPCHRVVAGNGKIGGFSSGVPLKRYLLKLEGIDI